MIVFVTIRIPTHVYVELYMTQQSEHTLSSFTF